MVTSEDIEAGNSFCTTGLTAVTMKDSYGCFLPLKESKDTFSKLNFVFTTYIPDRPSVSSLSSKYGREGLTSPGGASKKCMIEI